MISSFYHAKTAGKVIVSAASPKPIPEAYPVELKTTGDHIRKARLDRGLLQSELADSLGVSEDTMVNWENNRSYPRISYWGKLIEFLGYDPEGKEVGRCLEGG